jgi:ADP-ribose pyrophosphatase
MTEVASGLPSRHTRFPTFVQSFSRAESYSVLPRMKAKAGGPWRVIDSAIAIDTQHLRLRRDRIALPSGLEFGPYYVRESRGFSIVFALTPEERIVLVRQYTHGIGASVLELPAGGIDPDETPEDCARRELAEETGYASADPELERVGTYIFDPTSSTTRYHLYLARDAREVGPQSLDVTEDIAVELATFDELRRYVRDGTIDVGIHIASIYTVLDYLGRLPDSGGGVARS